MEFHHISYGQQVRLGAGQAAANVAATCKSLGASRPLLIHGSHTQDLAQRAAAQIEPVAVVADSPQHVPVPAAQQARETARNAEADVIVSVGGGSVTGMAKAVALDTGLPIIAVPTTYSGSEATWIWGMTEDGEKRTGADERVLPHTVIYDATFLESLPDDMAAASSLNAVAHCVDSLWAPRRNPITDGDAVSGLRLLVRGINALAKGGASVEVVEDMLLGTYLSARVFAAAGSGLHHKICHILGGAHNMPHAQTHATVLPYVVAITLPHAPEAQAALATALGIGLDEVAEQLDRLRETAGALYDLQELGLPEDALQPLSAKIAESVPAGHPGEVTEDIAFDLLKAAFDGEPAVTLFDPSR